MLKKLRSRKSKSKAPATVKELQKAIQPKVGTGHMKENVAGKEGLESIRELVKARKERQGSLERTASEEKLLEKWNEGEIKTDVELTTLPPRGIDPTMMTSISRQYFLNTTPKEAETARLPPFVPGMTSSDEDNLKLLPKASEVQARHHLTKRKTRAQLEEEKKYREEAWQAKLAELAGAKAAEKKTSVVKAKKSVVQPSELKSALKQTVSAPGALKPALKPAASLPGQPNPAAIKPAVKPGALQASLRPVELLNNNEMAKPGDGMRPGAGDAVKKLSTIVGRAEIAGQGKKVPGQKIGKKKKKKGEPSSSSSSSSSSDEDLWKRYMFMAGAFGGGGMPGYGGWPSPHPQTYPALAAQMRGFQVPYPNLFQPQQPIPKPKVDCRAGRPKKLNNDGLDFEFRPDTACGMEVTITIEPEEPDPIEFALDNGINPIVCCMMPPCLMVAPPGYQGQYQQQAGVQQQQQNQNRSPFSSPTQSQASQGFSYPTQTQSRSPYSSPTQSQPFSNPQTQTQTNTYRTSNASTPSPSSGSKS